LLECFERLLAAGHSLIAVDSDADVIRCADCVIEGQAANRTAT
jgi:excinuclease UvrABC ATPase subunit